jgi:hypothetical protein
MTNDQFTNDKLTNNMKRRNFIQKSALATAGSMLIPSFLKAFELNSLNKTLFGNKILVIMQ